MQEDYIEDEFLEEEESSNRRPFLIAVGALVSLFILLGACTAFFLFSNRAANDRADEVAAIETRNAEIEAANIATAVSATETAAAQPTNTTEPTPVPTDTPEPNTPVPTNTPVVEDSEDESTIDPEGEDSSEGEESSDEENDAGEDGADQGAKPDGDATPTAISGAGDIVGGNDEALPQTGLDSWGVIIAALGLVGLLIFVRRLRTTS